MGDVIQVYCFIPSVLVCVKMIHGLLELKEIFKFLSSTLFCRRASRAGGSARGARPAGDVYRCPAVLPVVAFCANTGCQTLRN